MLLTSMKIRPAEIARTPTTMSTRYRRGIDFILGSCLGFGLKARHGAARHLYFDRGRDPEPDDVVLGAHADDRPEQAAARDHLVTCLERVEHRLGMLPLLACRGDHEEIEDEQNERDGEI